MKASDLFDFPTSIPFSSFFDGGVEPWTWLSKIAEALNSECWEASVPENVPAGVHIEGKVFIHESVKLPAYCVIQGPAWIGEGVEIRPGAYIRGKVIIGAGSVVGNSCEYKNCLLMEKTQTPHFSYIGDSILGNGAHLGAGVILSNLRLDQKEVKALVNGLRVGTGLRKFGALFGDAAEAGCNSVLNPGSILGRRALLGPLSCFTGTLGADEIYLEKSEAFRQARMD
ncbi:UDP-N-acetylglucosamine diphosphorylase [Puniceicoccaceae bacterium K14]|nr:UDP-N-acetylglucosamine diphosphorylase [Puniceicoccaceae bacterium K14]